LSQKLGEPQPKTGGGSCAQFWFQIWGDRSHCWYHVRGCGFHFPQLFARSTNIIIVSIIGNRFLQDTNSLTLSIASLKDTASSRPPAPPAVEPMPQIRPLADIVHYKHSLTYLFA